jgi:hypothetical protein
VATDPFRDKRKKKPQPAGIVEHNRKQHAEATRRNRQAGLAKAREIRKANLISQNLALPEEVRVMVEQRMADIPDDNPIKRLCLDLGHNPMEAIVKLAKTSKEMKVRMELNKYLVDKLVPNLRAVDMQQKVKMQVSVRIQSFKDASQEALKKTAPAAAYVDADYSEFDDDHPPGK